MTYTERLTKWVCRVLGREPPRQQIGPIRIRDLVEGLACLDNLWESYDDPLPRMYELAKSGLPRNTPDPTGTAGELLHEHMTVHDLTPEALAVMIGLPVERIHAVLQGSDVSPDMALKLCKAFKTGAKIWFSLNSINDCSK